MKNLVLRDMSEEDIEFVHFVRNHDMTRSFLKRSEEISFEETSLWFREKKPNWLIIESESKKVGYLRTSCDSGESICIGCDIHPSYRRMGYAESAYEQLIQRLYDKNYVLIWLEVFEDNNAAKKLYYKLGFIDLGYKVVDSRKYVTMAHVRQNLIKDKNND